MRYLLALAFFLTVSINGVMAQPSLGELKSLKWSNRIILVSSNGYAEQIIRQLESRNLDIVDRDILWFLFHKDNIETNYSGEISQNFSTFIKSEFFKDLATRVVLLGKDGGVKEVSDELNLSALFALIDGMPMRRAEINQNAR
ncbi:MAG: DUF4174 domain-containing protein [Proteobacteria bacterium]|nr:DUF4174 domain-containing protein [Pseudomonadota bacterium]